MSWRCFLSRPSGKPPHRCRASRFGVRAGGVFFACRGMLVTTKDEILESFLEMQAAEGRAKDPGLADSRDIAAYQRQLAAAGMAPSTHARRLSAVRQLFKFLAAEG